MYFFYFIRFIIWFFWNNNNNIFLNVFEYCNWNYYDIYKVIYDIYEGIYGVIGWMDVN